MAAVLLAVMMGGCGSSSSLGEPEAEQAVVMDAEVAMVAEAEADEARVCGRGWPERSVGYHSGEVEHLALYLQDPFERWGSDDGRFQTWCFDDALAAAGGPAMFVGRTAAIGIEAAVSPPWQVVADHGTVPPTEPAHALPAEGSAMTRKEKCQ